MLAHGKMRISVHCTAHNFLVYCRKTGSTYIQHVLHDHLNSKGNLHYPFPENFAHHFVSEHIRFNKHPLPAKRMTQLVNYVNDLNDDAIVILSTESFCLMSARQLRTFHEFFPRYEIRVIMFYRNVFNWIYSLYQQNLKDKRRPISFANFIVQTTPLGNVSEIQAFEGIYDKFIDAFTDKVVRIVDYDGCTFQKVNVLDALLTAGGIAEKKSLIANYSVTLLNQRLSTDEIVIRQMWRLFDLYVVAKYGCTTISIQKNNYFKRSQMVPTTHLGVYVRQMPKGMVDLSGLKYQAHEVDKTFRVKYSNIMMYSDPSATGKLIDSSPPVYELRVDDVLMRPNKIWYPRFEEQYEHLADDKIECIPIEQATYY
jgi:hypothetical protein